MGGESFLRAGAGDGVEEGWARAIAAGETSVRSACFGDSKTKAAAGVPGRGSTRPKGGARADSGDRLFVPRRLGGEET